MNREIEFRAWIDKDPFGNMPMELLRSMDYSTNYDLSEFFSLYDPLYFPVMQYTGLKDKNGTKIFEGDILKDKFNDVYKVQFNCCGFMKHCTGKNSTNLLESSGYLEIGVIGNIHENPELLNQNHAE